MTAVESGTVVASNTADDDVMVACPTSAVVWETSDVGVTLVSLLAV